MKPTLKQVKNAANYLLNKHGENIRKLDVSLALLFRDDMNIWEKESATNRIWYQIKKIRKAKK